MKRQLGFALLGALAVAVGAAINGDAGDAGAGGALGASVALVGAAVLLTGLLGLILDLIRSED